MIVALLFVLSLVFAQPVLADAAGLRRDVPPPSYQVLGTGIFGKRSVLQKNLDDASANGYRVIEAFDLGRLLVRKTENGERYVYTAIDGADIESLEQELNAAGAAGFRLVPHAVLGTLSLTVMERRVGMSVEHVEYRVLSFEADHEIYDLYPGPGIGGGFQTDTIDEQLAAMAVTGYRLVALATQDVELHNSREPVVGGVLRKVLGKVLAVETQTLRRRLIVFFEKEAAVPTRTTAREAARRYHAVIESTEGEFEAALNVAAKRGYRLLTTAATAFPQVIAVVEKEATAAQRAYAVFVPSKVSRLTEELSEAAAAGWMVHSRGLLNPYPSAEPVVVSGEQPRTARLLLVLEREQLHTPGSILVLDAMRAPTLAKELNQATPTGFAVVVAGASNGLMVVVLQRVER